jgi:hypothetical protein
MCKHGFGRQLHPVALVVAFCAALTGGLATLRADERTDGAVAPASLQTALSARIDASLQGQSSQELVADDAVFLRRVSLDLTGVLPAPDEVRRFSEDTDPQKRERVVDKLLSSEAFARNWARYWRDVIAYRATDQRARRAAPALENWLTEQFKGNVGWDQIATELVTASGDIQENGQTYLVLAQMAQPVELAAETSRIFLGIQIQCAQCHDHPYDQWKREQFHQLAAFFSRVRIQRTGSPIAQLGPPQQMLKDLDADGDGKLTVDEFPQQFREFVRRVLPRADRDRDQALSRQELQVVRQQGGRSFQVVSTDQPRGPLAQFSRPQQLLKRFDADGDGRLSVEEVPEGRLRQFLERALRRADRDKDNALSLAELQTIRRQLARGGRGGREHRMPDLKNPQAPGTLMHPVFFVSDASPGEGKPDRERRGALAEYLTGPENPWFARAFVNRVWAALMGWGFYEPIDDLGPGRDAEYPEVLDALAEGFVDRGYDVKWLFATIACTQAYQQGAQPASTALESGVVCPSRLRSDQLYDSLESALGGLGGGGRQGRRAAAARRRGGGVRAQFEELFGFDPSTPTEELADSIPQALFLMNSPLLNRRISARGNTTLGQLLRNSASDDEVIEGLYLHVLAREPSEAEWKQCREYLGEVEQRSEGFEDLLWCLLNSTEFRLKH